MNYEEQNGYPPVQAGQRSPQESPSQGQYPNPQSYYNSPPQGQPPPQAFPQWQGDMRQPPPQGQYPGQPGGPPPYYQEGYPQPEGYPPLGYGQFYGYMPPKKKLPLGLKIFLFVFSFLVVGAFLGFLGVVGFYSLQTSQVSEVTPPTYEGEEFPLLPPEINPEPEGEAEPDIVQPNIEVTPNTQGLSIFPRPKGEELTAGAAYEKVLASTITVEARLPMGDGSTQTGYGTGIVVTTDGFIITNGHVVGYTKAAGVTIVTSDGVEHPAVVVGVDRATDLAVLKTEGENFTPAELGNAEELRIGEWVVAIGNPGGAGFTGSLTRGIISGLDRAVGYASDDTLGYIQTDAAINPGNSGGPLVNMHGQVVGINTSKIVADYYEGMGFAIPVNEAKSVIDDIMQYGFVQGRVRLGITCRTISQADAYMSGYPAGIQIESVGEDSSFAGSNVRQGDIITAVDGETIADLETLAAKLISYQPGDQLKVDLFRPGADQGSAGSDFTITITLIEDKGHTQG